MIKMSEEQLKEEEELEKMMRLELVEPTEEEKEYILSLFPIIKEIKDEDIHGQLGEILIESLEDWG